MPEAKETIQKDTRRKIAVDCFNSVWNLMEKKERTVDEDDKMIHMAHASRFHWGEIGTPVEFERGEWQISRMYTVLKRHEPALYHARRCLEVCKKNNIRDWDIAFAYEANARANAIAGKRAECKKFIELATKAGEQIKKKGDRDYLFSELKTIPC